MLTFLLALGSVAAPAPLTTAPQPLAAQPSAADHGRLSWFDGTWEELLAEAKRANRVVFVDFFTDTCPFCKRLDAETFSDETVVAEMSDVLCYAVNAGTPEGRRVAEEFGVKLYPTLLWLDPEGTEREMIEGFLPADRFLEEERRIETDVETLGSLRRTIEAEPANLDARFAFALKLLDLKRFDGYREQVAAIAELDPEGTSIPSRWIRFRDVRDQLPRNGYDLTALRELLAAETHGPILYEGWYAVWTVEDYLGKIAEDEEERAGHLAAFLEAGRTAWSHVPEDSVAYFGPQLATALYEHRGDLPPDERAFALEVARASVQAAPDSPRAHHALSCACSINGLREEALAAARKSVALDPKNPAWAEHLESLVQTPAPPDDE